MSPTAVSDNGPMADHGSPPLPPAHPPPGEPAPPSPPAGGGVEPGHPTRPGYPGQPGSPVPPGYPIPPGYPAPPGYGPPGYGPPPGQGPAGQPPPFGHPRPGYPPAGYGPPGHAPPGYPPLGYGPPGYGPPGYPPPGYGPPGYGPPGYAPPGFPTWAWAPPLIGSGRFRAQSFGELLDSSFTVYRRRFLPILAVMALFQLPYLAVEILLERSPLATILSLSSTPPPLTAQADLTELTTLISALVIVLAISLGYYIVLLPLAQGGVIRLVGDDYLDRPGGVGPALRLVLSRAAPLVGYALLELAIGLGPLAVSVAVALLIGGPAGAGLLVLLAIGCLVLDIFVFIRLSLGVQALILERLSPIAALRRSWRLTTGSFWRIFLFYLVINIVSGVVGGILGGLSSLIVGTAPALTQASIQVVASGLISIFTSPFLLILLTLVYYDIRIRREAFDIEMLAQSL